MVKFTSWGKTKSSGTLSCVIVFPLCRRLFREGSVLASVLDLTLSRGLVEVEKDVGRRVGIVVDVVLLNPVVESSLLKCFTGEDLNSKLHQESVPFIGGFEFLLLQNDSFLIQGGLYGCGLPFVVPSQYT